MYLVHASTYSSGRCDFVAGCVCCSDAQRCLNTLLGLQHTRFACWGLLCKGHYQLQLGQGGASLNDEACITYVEFWRELVIPETCDFYAYEPLACATNAVLSFTARNALSSSKGTGHWLTVLFVDAGIESKRALDVLAGCAC